MIKTATELIDGVNETVDGSKFGGVNVGEDCVGGDSVGSVKFKFFDIGFKCKMAWQEIGTEIFVETNERIADDSKTAFFGNDTTVFKF